MATTVEVPIRVRLDASALAAGAGVPAADLVADAVLAAAGRALATSAQVVPIGAAVPFEPTFSWYGNGLGSVTGADRLDLEAAVTGALATAFARATAEYRTEDGAMARPRGPVGEAVDALRHAPLLRRYLVDSYNGDGEPTAVEVDGADAPLPAERVRWVERVGRPQADWSEGQWVDAFLIAVDTAQQGVPASGVVGMLFEFSEGYAIRYYRVTSMDPGGVTLTDDILPLYALFGVGLDERGQLQSRRVSVHPRSSPTLHALGDTTTPEARLALKREWIREQVESSFRTDRDRLVAAMGAEAVDAAMRVALQRAAEASPDGPDIVGYVELRMGDLRFLISMAHQFGWPAGSLIPVVVFASLEPVNPTGTDEGGATEAGPAAPPGPAGQGGRGAGAGPGAGDEGDGPGGGGAAEVATGTGGRAGGGPGLPGGTGDADDGGLIEVPGEDDGGELQFPSGEGGSPLVCRPFLEEPPLSELGEDGDRLRLIIQRIASRLAIPTCEFAGGFAITAAAAVGARSADVGNFGMTATEAFLQPPAAATGNLGPADFTPAPSPAIAFLRHLGGVAPDLTALVAEIHRVYEKPEHLGKVRSFRDPVSWIWRFRSEVNGIMRRSVGVLFGMTCRILLMQLLRASQAQIRGRLSQIDAYAELFEQALLPRLRRIEDLISLRDRLRAAPATAPYTYSEALPGGVADSSGGSGADAGVPNGDGGVAPTSSADAQRAWESARTDLTDSLRDTGNPASSSTAGLTPPSGTLVWPATGGPRIHDGTGRTWAVTELEQAIVRNRGLVEEVDPLIKQLVELDEVLRRFDNPALGVRAELRSLLNEMLRNNAEQQAEVTGSWLYAFRASRINEHIPSATVPGTRYSLGGIHLQAHEAVGDSFHGNHFYALGIDALFGSEQGLFGIAAFFEFTGVLLLSIVCPPLGVAVGAGLAAYHLHAAHEREELYESLIDPEVVLTRAEVEAELFAARLGFALAIIPEAGTILRTGSRLGGTVIRAGARTAARRTVRRLAVHLAEESARSLRRGFLVALLREVAQDQVMEAIAQRVLEPIIADLQREVTVTGPVGGAVGASRAIDRLLAEPTATGRP